MGVFWALHAPLHIAQWEMVGSKELGRRRQVFLERVNVGSVCLFVHLFGSQPARSLALP